MKRRVIVVLTPLCLLTALGACATDGGPQVRIVSVASPTPISCIPADSPPPPFYVDTFDALKAAPDFAARYGLLAAEYAKHRSREAYLEALRASCIQAGSGHDEDRRRMTIVDWMLGCAALISALMSVGGVAISHGRSASRIDQLGVDVKELETRMAAIEAVKTDVLTLKQQIDHVGDRMADAQRIYAGELGRLADQIAAGHRLIDAKFDALREFSTRELNELKDGVRDIRRTLESRPARLRREREPLA